ncbi:hypothetical protein BDA99DRAFT_472813 [Phascolomyces articulosus]|uniref:BTB domain-containing protein n=1 Tax=Phascolomyces articulosus TaxID=60185 RepID=A0AAD5P8J0_9FUNG|nr:hypothetical protein BDA99DRAFT_472813 [Phascolomyces articulosus]
MLSIFKAVRDNNVDTVRDFVQLASAGTNNIIVNSNNNNTDKNKYYNYDPQQRQQYYRQLFQRYTKATGQKQFNINKRSIRGRTALHCAATWNRTLIAKILIDCPLVNINIQDRENGWTALHRALYMGNLEIALLLLQRGDADLTIKDWEGIRPLELLSITLHNFPIPKGVDPKDTQDHLVEDEGFKDMVDGISNKEATATRSGGTDLYSWGSNTNYLLGHRDSENRTNPEHVHLDHLEPQQTNLTTMMERSMILIQSVKMSKNHMAVLTSDSKHNLLLCGFGRGGRLGIGSEMDAQLLLQPVPWPERIIAAALGKDHTVGVSERGNVITFGSNEHGQLGYETEDMQQLVPRKIQAQSLKRQEIVGAAASPIHSVVYTCTYLFTFGYNKGQLGYHATGDDIRQASPRKVAFNNKIKQVVAVEYATAVLLESKEVILLCNNTQQKIIFPTNRFPSNIQVYTSASTYMVKLIQSGDEYLGAISNMGEVYLWTCRPSNAKQQQGDNKTKSISSHQKQSTTVSAPKRIWDLKKPHLAATDASLGHHGELIVSTVSGQVFVGSPSKDGYKFRMIPKLQRCIQVCASPSGAFAAIRSEATPKEVYPERSTFTDDLSTSLPHIIVSRQLERDINQLEREKKADIELLHQRMDELMIDDLAVTDDNAMDEKENAIHMNYNKRLNDTIIKAWDQAVSIASQDTTADVIFLCETFPKPIYCHGCVLISRSPFFKRLFNSDKKAQHPDLDICWIDPTKSEKGDKRLLEVHIQKPISISAILLFFDYVYTDIYTHPMTAYYKQPSLSRIGSPSTGSVVQKDLILLASIFGMDLLYDSASLTYGNTPRPRIKTDMLHVLDDQNSCDVVLDLKDGHHIMCHEVILRQRCPFFEALFEPGSIWMDSRREQVTLQDPLVHVQMTHVSKELMLPLLQYLYADMDENELFGDDACDYMAKKETPDEMMHYLIEVLCLADELLLTRLKRVCERALIRFLKLRTASHLLESADLYLASWLKDSCLDFIAANLDIFLTSGMLKDIDSQVIQELERYVRWCQAYQLPSVRNIMLSSPSPTTDEDDVDEEFESSLYTLSREDMPIINTYYETLVTILPETPSPSTPKNDEDEGIFAMDEDEHLNSKTTSTTLVKKKKSTSKNLSLDEHNKKSRKQQQRQLASNGSGADGSTNTHSNNNGTNTSWQGWVPTPAMSLGSVDSKISLREVLEQHPKPSELASTPPSSFGKSPPHIPKKLSQKERRKLQQQEIAAAAVAATPKPAWGKTETAAQTQPPIPMLAKASSTPVLEMNYPSLTLGSTVTVTKDGSTAGSSTTNTSMSNSSTTSSVTKQMISKKELINKVEVDGSKGKKIYVSKEELDHTLSQYNRRSNEEDKEDDKLFKPELSLGSKFTFTPIRRKHGPRMTRQNSQEQPAHHSFQAIQKQQEQEDLWIKGKQARKNLIQIQAEEQAMDGLQQFYVQTLDAKSGDWFEVNRLET